MVSLSCFQILIESDNITQTIFTRPKLYDSKRLYVNSTVS